MRHYSRENERSQSRIAELERRKNTCEAGLVAMSACWNQVPESFTTTRFVCLPAL
jgi:E3 ubiquitin-protein ligase BRE1